MSATSLDPDSINIPRSHIGLSDGFHCTDLTIRAGTASSAVKSVQDQGLKLIGKWLKEWKSTGDGHSTQPAPEPHHGGKPKEGATVLKPVNAWFKAMDEVVE